VLIWLQLQLLILNSLDLPGVPPHQVHSQVGWPIISLRNLPNGVANGTRLIVAQLMERLIDAEVATGPMEGQRVLLSRLTITPSNVENFPFTLERRRFPVRTAFAITINKSQGQTLNRVGVYLPQPVFTHGQLYVAGSHTGDPDGLKICVPGVPLDEGMFTRNVVYRQVLLHY
jgi:ATP-dependent DNA helicase PIF1